MPKKPAKKDLSIITQEDIDAKLAEYSQQRIKPSERSILRIIRSERREAIQAKHEQGKKLTAGEEKLIRQDEEPKVISKEIEEFKKAVFEQAEPPAQLFFSFMPNALTRTTPFFPMTRNAPRPFETLEFETSWGTIKIEGRKLSVYDESVLLAILTIVRRERTATIQTTTHELCKIMGVTPQKHAYTAILQSIKRLTGTYIELSVMRKSQASRELFGTILVGGSSGLSQDRTVSVNPYFLETLAKGFLDVDVKFRSQLEGEVSKALYRFLGSQNPNPFECHLLKLCRAVNLEVPDMYRLRYRVRKGLTELKKKGFITRFMVTKGDIVKVWKSKKPTKTT